MIVAQKITKEIKQTAQIFKKKRIGYLLSRI